MSVRSEPRDPRLGGIEGMRALAAVAVLVYHVFLYGAPGEAPAPLGPLTKPADSLQAGVTLFFVLSGFLLYRPYVASVARGLELPRLRPYLLNRALRILPAYWAILLATAVLFERDLLRQPAQLAANWFLLQTYVPSYVNGAGIVPAWSLTVEIVFYLLVPALGALVALGARRRLRPVAAALVPVWLMVAIGFATKAAMHGVGAPAHLVLSATFPAHADWFAVGMGLAVARVAFEDGRLALPRRWPLAAPVAALALAAASLHLYYAGTLDAVEVQTPIAVALGLAASVVFLARPGSRVVRALEWRPLAVAGLGSYSLFLWHDPLLRAMRGAGWTVAGAGGFVLNLLLVAAVAGACSALTYRLVERPALARKRAWSGGRPAVEAEPMGSIEPRDVPADDASLLRPVEGAVAELPDEARSGVAVAVDPELPVPAPPAAVREIVARLVDNAVRYGAPPIAIEAARTRDGIELLVRDHGRGIDPAFVSRLFEPGARSEASRAASDGAGLGLAGARTLAGSHGATVEYLPGEPRGACFRVHFGASGRDGSRQGV